MNNYLIHTDRLGLRKWISTDFAPFAQINKDTEVMEYFLTTLTNDQTKQMVERISFHFDKYGFGLYALEKLATKEFIGYTGFMVPNFESFFTPCVEIGWRIKKDEWNNGYATEAAKACIEYGFDKLQFDKIYSFTSVKNLRSERVMQKIGMVKEGEFDHPNIPPGHWLYRHILYKIERRRGEE